MQLVAYGAQDIYLTGNPQITFFKVVYRRHTNFSMEAIRQTFNGNADFGGDATATISRNGDLVYRMYLEHGATFPTDSGTNNIGLVERYGDSLIKECEIEIGGQRIDKHTSLWNRVYSDLTEFNPSGHFGNGGPGNYTEEGGTGLATPGTGTLYQLMTGNGYGLTSDASAAFGAFGVGVSPHNIVNGFTYNDDVSIVVNRIFLPLNFWFNRNPGLALPLIALQYHEVKVKMTFENINELRRNLHATNAHGIEDEPVTISMRSGQTFDLWCDYIYLDTDERRRFAQVSHEYLIEQLQYSENSISSDPSIDLNFNHPVKELIWCAQNTGANGRHGAPPDSSRGTTKLDSTAGPASLDGMAGNWQLKLNGHDRFAERDTRYFTRTQVWQHHTGYGGVPTRKMDMAQHIGANDYYDGALTGGGDSIAVYSFALKPEEHQPSGTCNFSRIDNAQLSGSSLQIENVEGTILAPLSPTDEVMKLTVFAVNYNVLRIMSGMGGLAYSN